MRDRLVERRVGALGDHAVREQPDERRGGEGDRPEDAHTHAGKGIRVGYTPDLRGRCPMAKTLASQAKDGGSIPLARSVLEGFETAYDQALSDLGRFNLAIFGKTGVGKSTLINAMFGADVAKTGTGRPVTLKTQYFEHPSGLFGVYDSEGIEIGEEGREILARFHDLIAEKRTRPIEEQIHVVWYCVRAADLRFEDAQAAFIERRWPKQGGVPIVFVLTQVHRRDWADSPRGAQAGAQHHRAKAPARARVEPRLLHDRPLPDGWGGWEAFGLQDLLDATFRVAPDGVANALTAAQTIDLARKAARARRYVTRRGAVGRGRGRHADPRSPTRRCWCRSRPA